MGGIIGALIVIVLVIGIPALTARSGSMPDKRVPPPSGGARHSQTMSCPNCGSPAMVKGSYWECGYCGDSGLL